MLDVCNVLVLTELHLPPGNGAGRHVCNHDVGRVLTLIHRFNGVDNAYL